MFELSLTEKAYKKLVNHASTRSININDLLNTIIECGLDDPKVLEKVVSLLREKGRVEK